MNDGETAAALAVLLVFALAPVLSPAAGATTVLDWDVLVEIEAGGDAVERERLRVRLDAADDLDDVSPYPVFLDENRELEELEVHVVRPDGGRERIRGRDRFDTVDLAGGGTLHSSQKIRLVEIPPQPAGTVVEIASVVREEPWFESGRLALRPLGGEVAVERLRIEIVGADLRWHLEPVQELTVDEDDGRLVLTGSLDESPDDSRLLRYAWGPVGTWSDVGGWYERLVAAVPRRSAPVTAAARRVLDDMVAAEAAGDPRQTVAALTDFVRDQVRYVAVEVGVGGYRPTPPEETLARAWGDCKDKSFLLIDLLAEAGVPAYPALVRAADDARVEAAFPSADQFNHLIVAVPADAVPERPTDVRRDGYLFLDPTQERGELAWLHPAVQGQHALVVRPGGSELVETPVLSASETSLLTADLTVAADGSAVGPVMLRLSGRSAANLARAVEDDPRRLEELARRAFRSAADPTELDELAYGAGEVEGIPLVELSATARFAQLATRGREPSLRLPGWSPLSVEVLPDGDEEADDLTPTAVSPWEAKAVWTLRLPAGWCPPAADTAEVATSVGRFDQTVEPGDGGGSVVVTRRSQLPVRWIEPADRAAARELAVESRRISRRRMRLGCPSDQASASAGQSRLMNSRSTYQDRSATEANSSSAAPT